MSYAPEEHVISHGKKIEYATPGDTPSYTQIFATTEINFPERELGKAETTNDSSPDNTKEYLPGLFEPGTVTFSYRYGKTQFGALETIYQSRALKLWRVTAADGSKGVVTGFLLKHNLPLGEGEDVATVECEIQCIGKMTFTAAS